MGPTNDYGTEFTSGVGRFVVGVDAPSLEVGFYSGPDDKLPGPAVFVFEGFSREEECLVSASLTIKLSAEPPTVADAPLTVYAGRPELAELQTGDRAADLLIDNRPKAEVTFSNGTGVADVTEVLRTWLGGTFPSLGLRVDETDPLVLVVQPAAATSPETTAVRTTESGPGTSPVLQLHTGC